MGAKKRKWLHFIPHLDQGGAERLLVDLTRADERQEHVIVTLFSGPHFFETKVGGRVETLGGRRGSVGLLLLPWMIVRALMLLRTERPEAVAGWLYLAAPFASLGRLVGAHVVWSIHATRLDFSAGHRVTGMIMRLLRPLSRTALVQTVHYCSKEGLRDHEAQGFDARKSRFFPNGIDTSRFKSAAAARSQCAVNGRVKTIACVARFTAQKDHVTLFEALGLLKAQGVRFVCQLAGHGCAPDNAELARLITRYEIDDCVNCLGAVEDVASIYGAADVAVLSSAYGEAMPLVLLEAMACGCPVVATDVGDCKALVGPYGRIVPPRAPGALAEALMAELDGQAGAPLARGGKALDAPTYVDAYYSIEAFARSWRALGV